MADITVHGPDGAIITFPEGTPQGDIIAAMSQRYPQTAPGSGGGVYSEGDYAGQPVSVGQERALAAAGGLNQLAPVGSDQRAYFETPDRPGPNPTGTTYLRSGEVVQTDARPISETLMATAGRAGTRWLGGASGFGATGMFDDLARGLFPSGANDAAESGLMSGLLMGGKNELGAIDDGLAAMRRGDRFGSGFDSALAASDETDRVLRENHPLAYYGGGAAGTAVSAALTPEIKAGGLLTRGLVPQIERAVVKGANIGLDTATGALSGALSSDPGERGAGALAGAGLTLPLSRLLRGRVMPGASGMEPPLLTPLVESLTDAERTSAVRRLRKIVPKKGLSPASPDMMVAEAMGPAGVRELGTLARREGETGEAVAARLHQRRIGRPDRLLGAQASPQTLRQANLKAWLRVVERRPSRSMTKRSPTVRRCRRRQWIGCWPAMRPSVA